MPRHSIRTKLTVGALIPFAVAMVICTLTGFYLIDTRVAHQAQEKVRTDINSARETYQSELTHLHDILQTIADTSVTSAAVAGKDRRLIEKLILPLQKRHNLDLLTVVDSKGTVLMRGHNLSRTGDNLSSRPCIARALKGTTVQGSEILSQDQLQQEWPELVARQAAITPVSTPRSRLQPSSMVGAGMFLVAAEPVRDETGSVVGVLQAGVMLNNNNALVDRIKHTVYEGVQYQGKDVGTATIFLDDIRIATNVMTTDGERAIGTRLSEEVYNRVVQQQQKWVGRAFVVNDWYITAYEPIKDLSGKVIGSLYVGMLERPYTALKKELFYIFTGVVLVCTIICLGVSSLIGAQLALPVKTLENVARRVAEGERQLQATVRTNDELEDLAGEFNEMTKSLAQREDEISELNRNLEQKVAQRTAQLEEKTSQLLQAQKDLARAEKLAGLGTLAAGVAHEINNPLAIIRGNTEVLEMSLPSDHPQQEEVRIIARQIERMTRIIGNLLSFARQRQLRLRSVSMHRLLDDEIGNLSYQTSLKGIHIVRNFDPDLISIQADLDQLRQVVVNLLNNAVQAMNGNGTLTVTTHIAPDGKNCLIEITDTGCGISDEHLGKIFTPFFTTKQNGTGLGLAVSYGIIKDHGGDISVSSSAGHGTTFRVTLPTKITPSAEQQTSTSAA